MIRLSRPFLRKSASSPNERREHPRHPTNIETMCRPVSDPVELPARIINLSNGGVLVRLGKLLREGTMIRVDLPKVGGSSVAVLACVMHVHQVGRFEWDVGCNFSLELSEEEIQALGGQKIPTAASDLRAWVRHPARGTVDYRQLPGHEGPPDAAELVNLSPAGAGLVVESPLEPGTALLLTLKRLDNKPDRQLLACVVYQAARDDGKWAIGCNFLHRLSEMEVDELLWASSF
jgi:hypothetical protein